MSKKKKAASSASPAPAPVSPAPAVATEPIDPRRRMIANIALVGFGIYVGMIWLLALDQQFHWGIFKP